MTAWRLGMLQHQREYVQNQIALGDAKAAGIVAWNAVLTGSLPLVVGSGGLSASLPAALIVSAGAFLSVSFIWCFTSLFPRTPSAGGENRLSFVDFAKCSRADFHGAMKGLSEKECERQLCDHIHLLGGIASAKFKCLSTAIRCSGAATILMILLIFAV